MTMRRMMKKQPAHLVEVVLGDVQGGIEEVQDVAGVLDAVLGRLLGGGETVVAGATEILVAAGAVLEAVRLPGHDGVLLGHTGEGKQTEMGQKSKMFTPKNLKNHPKSPSSRPYDCPGMMVCCLDTLREKKRVRNPQKFTPETSKSTLKTPGEGKKWVRGLKNPEIHFKNPKNHPQNSPKKPQNPPPKNPQKDPPDVEFLAEHEVVVEVGDGSVHGVTIGHLHHGCTRLALHELHLHRWDTDR